MIRVYILVDRVPVEATIVQWGEFLNSPERQVDLTALPGDMIVSTVFLGLDPHRRTPPQLFETMIFGGPHDRYQDRCSTWEEAVAMHRKACALARTGLTQVIP